MTTNKYQQMKQQNQTLKNTIIQLCKLLNPFTQEDQIRTALATLQDSDLDIDMFLHFQRMDLKVANGETFTMTRTRLDILHAAEERMLIHYLPDYGMRDQWVWSSTKFDAHIVEGLMDYFQVIDSSKDFVHYGLNSAGYALLQAWRAVKRQEEAMKNLKGS